MAKSKPDWDAIEAAALAQITPENYRKEHGSMDGWATWSAVWPYMLRRYYEFERNFDNGLVPDRTTCGMDGLVSIQK